MKVLCKILLLLIAGIFVFPAWAQEVVFEPSKDIIPPHRQVRVSFLVGFGLINPVDVNGYIREYINDMTSGGYYISYGGSTDISVESLFNLAVVVPVSQNVQLKLPIEYGVGSRQVTIDSDKEMFTMNRFATGVLADYYFHPSEANSLFLGMGLLYNLMWFEGYKANSFSPRFELGYRMQLSNSEWEFLLMADIAKGQVNNQTYYDPLETIDFTGILFGIRFVPN